MAKSERLKQNSTTGKIRPAVKLVSATDNPVGTLFTVWHGSRHKESFSAEDIQYLYDNEFYHSTFDLEKVAGPYLGIATQICKDYPEHAGDGGDDYKNVIRMVCKNCIETNVPASECVNFVFEVDEANVAWREQLVRGKHQGFWTQSTRTIDMTTMDVNMSDSVEILGGEEAVKIYNETVDTIRKAYVALEALGVPIEDIRLQPQQHVHRVYWMISARTLVTILNKRADWIAQASLWTPVISSVCGILRDSSFFSILEQFIGKPPVKVSHETDIVDKYYVSEYIMNADNEDRYYGRDPLPCDPLWLASTGKGMPEHTDIEFYDYLKSMYIQIWGDEYLAVVGWDRNDPSKLGPYDRPHFDEATN